MEERDELETMEETMDVLNQVKNILRMLRMGESPEDGIGNDLWTELELALSEVIGTLSNKKPASENKEYVDFLVSVRLKNIDNMVDNFDVENYPQIKLNFLLISYTIKLLDKYYNSVVSS
ncbi:hypothetical protein MettiDRAFT_0023 [Methanolobus tindarius DSM 2278]|uniref:Uncharacterized protein n=1 Tax=Methanolobus tindarius DSM 2278 TaxID=1090322 RepID=W9DNS1_METTI|nr:hypothetical protein [Methanolobus tindarius]ETA66625.1 hypothetical protein MettiDRAFT_0023 [Methanolobus tindarius DSM 2278]